MTQAEEAAGPLAGISDRLPTVSLVVCTDGRLEALTTLLASLGHVDYPRFEVCLVCGPTEDGSREFAERRRGALKIIQCGQRNLSLARNLGAAAAAGDIIAFIDDDSVPEPEWLRRLVAPFTSSDVAAAGGPVYDHTGARLQYGYAACDRLGNPKLDLDHPPTDHNYPFSNLFPYVQGTNCAVRRDILVALGGFDEEYEFYLDETDFCCRVVDAGGRIAQLDDAVVHHHYLPSAIRNIAGVTIKKFAVLKNKIYFSHLNNHGHFSEHEVICDGVKFIEDQRAEIVGEITAGRLLPKDLAAFEDDASRAWRMGLAKGLAGRRRTRPREFFSAPAPFLSFPKLQPSGERLSIALVSSAYPPTLSSGIARYTHDLAQALGQAGHTVHVLAESNSHDRVDFEGDVWVHRIATRTRSTAPKLAHGRLPQHIWDRSESVLAEIRRIETKHPLNVVEFPSWDVEGYALAEDGGRPTVVNLVTGLAHWLQTHGEERDNPEWMRSFGEPMMAAERRLLERSDLVIASTPTIARDFQALYGVEIAPERLANGSYGLADMAVMPRRRPEAAIASEHVKALLFVGRLELRKGIDTLLHACASILRGDDRAEIWLVGRELPLEGGRTARTILHERSLRPDETARVRFFGEVGDAELRWLYADACAVLVPSRYESFGLTPVEAAMFSKPSICSRGGGLSDVVEADVTALLVPPDDPAALARAALRLLKDDEERNRMGAAARRRYDTLYGAAAAAKGRLEAYRRLPALAGLRARDTG